MRHLALVIGALALLSPPPVAAQLTVIRGRVVAQDDAAFPMRGARVELVGSSAKVSPIWTDGEGRFALGVPLMYTLKISKAGFAPAILSGGSGSADAPAERVIRLSRGAVITGQVDDELGFEVVAVGVRARRMDPLPSDIAAGVIEFAAETDDAGRFRLGSLPPGRYTIHSEPRLPVRDLAPMLTSEIDVARVEAMARSVRAPWQMSDAVTVTARTGEESLATLTHRSRAVASPDSAIGGAVTGLVVDAFGEPLDGVTVRAWRVRYVDGRRFAVPSGASQRTDDRGHYRLFHLPPGQYLIGVDDDDVAAATVFHPDTTTPANASPITVGRSRDTPGAHVTFTRSRLERIAGVAFRSDGAPLHGTVMLTASRRSGALALPRLTMTATDGVYDFLNVPPGEYMLRAASSENPLALEVGIRSVVLPGPDVPPIPIRAVQTAIVSGRIVVEGRDASPDDLHFGIMAVPDSDYAPPGARRPTSLVRDDRTFEIRGLAGPTRFAMIDGPPGWVLKSVDIQGVNAAEDPVMFGGLDDSRHDVVVTVADSGGAVSGIVHGDPDRTLDDYRVVLFSTAREKWFGGSPYVRMTGGPDADGGFSIVSVRPGEYFIAAVDVLEGDGASGEWETPEFMDRMARLARRITVSERQKVPVDLRLIRR
jgi:hypothetical protein